MDRRPLVGLSALLLLAIGAALYILRPTFIDGNAIPAICIRVGLLLAVLWLAIPDLGKIPRWLWMNILLTAVVVAWRPPAALLVVPALFASWLLRPKRPA
jgi:hypothetical protein